MKKSFLDFISCPCCQNKNFELQKESEDNSEIREGQLICENCKSKYAINSGILFLYKELSQAVTEEQLALKEELKNQEKLLSAHDATWLLNFPYDKQVGYDKRTERIIRISADNALLFLKNIRIENKKILELGAGNTWLTAKLAKKNYCVALDIFTPIPKGLESADIFIKQKGLFFERIVSDMKKLPFQNNIFDIIIINSALHHSSNLEQTLKEIYRVLIPKGQLILLNEPSMGLFAGQERQQAAKDIEYGISENRYAISEWKNSFIDNGYEAKIYLPENFSNVLKSKGELFNLLGSLLKLMPLPFEKFIINNFGSFILTYFDGFFNAIIYKI